MKTLKKALSIVLALALMLSCVAGMQVSVSAEGEEATTPALVLSASNPQYDLANVDPEKVGLVGVTVRVGANAGFAALGYEVTYDEGIALNYVVKDGEIADYPITDENQAESSEKLTDKPYKMQWAFTGNQTAENFTIAYLQFKLPEGVAAGTNYTVTFTVKEAWDQDGNAVAVTESFTSTISVVDNTPVEPEEPAGPAVDENLKFQGASVGYGTASLQINFRVRNSVLALYDDVKIVIMPQKYDLTTFNLVEDVPEVVVEQSQLSAAGSTMKSYLYTDIYLYELGLNIDYMLKGYDAEGNLVAVSPVYTTSAADYLKSVFATSSDAKFRTLVTDTIVVGAASASQMAAANPDSDLAKAPSIIAGFDISEATPAIDSYNTTNIFNSYNDNFKNTSSTHQFRTSVQIGKAPSITYRLKDSKGALDLSKLSFHVSYSRLNASGQTITFDETFTTANADISLISGWVNFKFDQIGLQGGSTDITTQVIYDGDVVCDSTYSVETYLGAQLNGSIGELAAALIKLGISYRAYSA